MRGGVKGGKEVEVSKTSPERSQRTKKRKIMLDDER